MLRVRSFHFFYQQANIVFKNIIIVTYLDEEDEVESFSSHGS